MKNAKKVILFLGAISLVAFGSFNMTGNKSNKNTVAESKETETDKKENKKADAVAVAVEQVTDRALVKAPARGRDRATATSPARVVLHLTRTDSGQRST